MTSSFKVTSHALRYLGKDLTRRREFAVARGGNANA